MLCLLEVVLLFIGLDVFCCELVVFWYILFCIVVEMGLDILLLFGLFMKVVYLYCSVMLVMLMDIIKLFVMVINEVVVYVVCECMLEVVYCGVNDLDVCFYLIDVGYVCVVEFIVCCSYVGVVFVMLEVYVEFV